MAKGRILVVDRSETFLLQTSDILKGAGYEMIAATDGSVARSVATAKNVDGIVANVSLPGLDGTDLCKEMRTRDETIPCYLMIPHDDDELRAQCLDVGARNVLVRPLKRTELLFAARSLMNLRSLLRQHAAPASESTRGRERVPPPPGASVDDRASFFQFELFKRLLAIELKRSRRYGFPLSVLLVSPDGESMLSVAEGETPVDGFDADAATIVGHAVSQAIRDIDIPMHFADDNIMIVMPHTEREGALVVAERIRRKARSGAAAITVSIGATSFEGAARLNFDQLVARASRALAIAKKAGGDRVEAA